MKFTYIIANWKSNKTTKEVESWIATVSKNFPKLAKNIKVVICPSLIHLGLFQSQLPQVALGVQNLSSFPDGAYTGETSARMLEDLISFALLGHSERRRYLKETNAQISLKVIQALEYNITPIIAVDKNNWRSQLNQLETNQKNKSIIMYEPPEAIGRDEPSPLNEVVDQIAQIKQANPQSPVLYGGSVKSHHLANFLTENIIDGVVVGSASLNSDEWLKILTISQKIRG